MKNAVTVSLLALCILALTCAKRGVPQGGPPDETAPFVDALIPESGSTEVGLDSDIRITFSESMKKRTVETGVVVSPPLRWKKRYWEGDTYIMVPHGGLLPNATYLVSVTNKAMDSHSVRMESAFVGGFSTGVAISAGRISGSVKWKTIKVDDAAVVVLDADTLDLGPVYPKEMPVYLTLTDNGGLFEVPFVDTSKTYWVLAFMDKNGNAEHDEGEVTGCFGGRLNFESGAERTGVDILLCKETLCGSIKGSVDSLALSNYPQVGITAGSVEDTTLSYSAICGKTGAFAITCMEPGTYSVAFYADADSNSAIGEGDSLLYRIEPPVKVGPCREVFLKYED
jgi:hypothetical protein